MHDDDVFAQSSSYHVATRDLFPNSLKSSTYTIITCTILESCIVKSNMSQTQYIVTTHCYQEFQIDEACWIIPLAVRGEQVAR